MNEELDVFIDQFYGKYSPNDIPQGDRRTRLKEKLQSDFDGYVGQMYTRYAPTNKPDSTRLASLRSKYLKQELVDESGAVVLEEEQGLEGQPKVSEAEAIGSAIEAVNPIAKPIYDFGRTIYSGLTDTAPQTAAQALEVAKTAINPSNIEEYIRNKKPLDFQRYVREKDQKFKGIGGFFTSFGEKGFKEFIPKYGKQFLEDEGLGEEIPRMEQNLPKVIERRKNLEEYVQLQKQEAQQKLGGVVQDYRDIKNVSDFGSYISGLGGQAAYQIPLSVGTRGLSSYVMESATIYDKQLDNLAKEHGISREEVIERNLDNPAVGQAYAVVAGALDATSAGNMFSAFKKSGGSLLKKWLSSAAPEALTEPAQGILEDVGAGGTVEEAVTGEGFAARLNELFGGAVGGSLFSFAGKTREKNAADEAINRIADTGDPQLNSMIEAEATLTPEEEEIVKTKLAGKRLEEIKLQEEKLTKRQGKELSKIAFEEAVISSKNQKTPDLVGNWVLQNSTVGDSFTLPSGVGYEVTDFQQKENADKEVSLTPFRIEDGAKVYDNTRTKIISTGNTKQADAFFKDVDGESTDQVYTHNAPRLRATPTTDQDAGSYSFGQQKESEENLQEQLAENTATIAAESTENKSEDSGTYNFSNPLRQETSTTGATQTAQESPEYQQAVSKVSELSRLLADPATTPEMEQAYYRQLAETKQALRQIAPKKITGKKSDVQKRIEATTGVAKPEKSVKMTPLKQREYEIKAIDFGVKLGRDLTQEQVVSKIKEAAKTAKLSPKQVQTLTSHAERVSLTPESIRKFETFVKNVVEDADYADKFSQANKLRKQIKTQAKGSARSVREKNFLKVFSKINPTDVIDITEYNNLASTIQEGFRAVPVNLESVEQKMKDLVGKIYQQEFQAAPRQTSTVEDMLSYVEENRDEDRETNRLQKAADDLNIDIDEVRLLEESEDPMTNAAKKEKLRQSYLPLAKKAKSETSDVMQKEDVENINKIDPSLLTLDELKEYIRVVDRINENDDFGLAGRMASKGRAQEGWRELNKLNTKTLNLTWMERQVDSQPMAIEAIFGLPKDAALFQLYTGIKPMNDGGAISRREAESFADILTQLQEKQKGQGFTDESLFRQGVYQELIRKPESMSEEDALKINKQLVQSSIQRKRENGFVKEADTDAKFFKPFEKAATIEEVKKVMERIDPAGKQVMDAMIDYHENHKVEEYGMSFLDIIQSDNERFENKIAEKVSNYGSPRSWVKIGRGQKVDFDDIAAFNPSTAKTSKPKQIRSGRELTMKDREGHVLNFNVHKNAVDNIEKSLLRALVKPYQYQVREVIKNEEGLQKLFGLEKNNPESVKRTNNLIDNIFNEDNGIFFEFERDLINNGRPEGSKLVQFVGMTLQALKRMGYSLTLSGYTQAPKQATVLTNVARNLGSDIGLLGGSIREATSDDNFKAFFRGETVDVRGELRALLNVGQFHNASDRLETESKIKKFFMNMSTSSEKKLRSKWGGIGVLTKTDVNMAKVSYLAFYKKYLKDADVEYLGLEEEIKLKKDKVRQEARAFAKQRVDTLQVVSTPAEQSAFFKEKGVVVELVRSFFVPYGGFSSNIKTRLFNDYKALVTGNSKQRSAAWRDIQGTFLEQLTYNAVSQSVKLTLYGAVGLAIREAFDLDDEESLSEWWEKTQKQVTKDMIFTAVPLIIGQPAENASIDLLNSIYLWHLKKDNPKLTQREYEKEYAPLTRYKNYDAHWWDYIGPHGASIGKIADGIKLYQESLDKSLPSDVRDLATLTATIQYLQLLGLIPADISNAMRAEYFKQKSGAKENKGRRRRPAYLDR